MSPAFLFPADADELPTDCSLPAVSVCEASAETDSQVGQNRLSHIALRELQAHMASCHYLRSLATARYRGSRSLADAQEAGRWMVLKEEAAKAVLAARRAQFDADHLDMAGGWTEGICQAGQQQENV